MKPRNDVNLVLCVSLQLFSFCLFWLVSHSNIITGVFLAIIFSFAMLTNYCLIHEASHNNLNSSPKINWLMGTLAACLFPVSLTFYKNAHLFHHMNNRSEYERFEYYDPNASWWSIMGRHLQWYAIVIGTHWLFIPITSFIAAIIPWVLKLWPINQFISTKKIFSRLDASHLKCISIESLIIVVYWLVIWELLDLSLMPILIMYACFAFNWSTRQYVAHAFTPLDKDTGALNLKVSSIMEKVLLYSNWHLLHHQHPEAPWHKLPELAENQPSKSYLKQYIKLWAAPIKMPLHAKSYKQ